MKEITTIIFDLSEVLIPGYAGVSKLAQEQLAIDEHEFERVRWRINGVFVDAMRGLLTEKEYFKQLAAAGGWDYAPERFGALLRQNFCRDFEGNALGVLRVLKDRYRLVLLSDHIKEWIDFILAHRPELTVFDEMVFSYQLGAIKGDLGTFSRVLDLLDARPEECVFVDDLSGNVWAASQSGINAILYVGAEQLLSELEKYDIRT